VNQIISQQAVKGMLVKNFLIDEIEETFDIKVSTDPGTLQAIARTEILCKLTPLVKKDCINCENDVIYIEGKLKDSIITCFKGQI
jgi:hypothetical protein